MIVQLAILDDQFDRESPKPGILLHIFPITDLIHLGHDHYNVAYDASTTKLGA